MKSKKSASLVVDYDVTAKDKKKKAGKSAAPMPSKKAANKMRQKK